jgi:formate/nitrite transporter FocA (FNT family)
MSSDLKPEKDEEQEPKKDPAQILEHEIKESRASIERPTPQLFVSGLSAGLDIGFSLLLMAVMKYELDHLNISDPAVQLVSNLLIANMYAVGFIIVVLGRSELFTEQTTLAVLSVLNRQASVAALARVWSVVYVANLIGAALFAAFVVQIGPALGITSRDTFREIAEDVINHPAWVIFLSGVLAGWLMGLLSWLVVASRDTISQIVIVWLIATVIGFTHLHHVVVGSVEVLAGVFASKHVTLGDYGWFLLWATLGNAIGGPVFVALIKFGHASGGKTV